MEFIHKKLELILTCPSSRDVADEINLLLALRPAGIV